MRKTKLPEAFNLLGEIIGRHKKFYALLKHLFIGKSKIDCERISILINKATKKHSPFLTDTHTTVLSLWSNVHYDDTAVCNYYQLRLQALVATKEEDKKEKIRRSLETFIGMKEAAEASQQAWDDYIDNRNEEPSSDTTSSKEKNRKEKNKLDMRHIQYQGETLSSPFPLPPFPFLLAFHLVLGKFHI